MLAQLVGHVGAKPYERTDTRRGYRAECLAGAKRIYLAQSYRAAVKRFRRWAREWQGGVPKAVACVEEDLEKLLAYMKVLRKQRGLLAKVRTTNVIERMFREFRKRGRPVCSFTDAASCDRIVYAVCNKRWKERPLWKPNQTTQNS